jgi:hypothetical protein
LAALRAEQTLAAYAREHHLSRHTLYIARLTMQRRGELPAKPRPRGAAKAPSGTVASPPSARRGAPAAFVPVVVSGGTVTLTVQLPNGVRVHCEAHAPDLLPTLFQHLVMLPCSG